MVKFLESHKEKNLSVKDCMYSWRKYLKRRLNRYYNKIKKGSIVTLKADGFYNGRDAFGERLCSIFYGREILTGTIFEIVGINRAHYMTGSDGSLIKLDIELVEVGGSGERYFVRLQDIKLAVLMPFKYFPVYDPINREKAFTFPLPHNVFMDYVRKDINMPISVDLEGGENK